MIRLYDEVDFETSGKQSDYEVERRLMILTIYPSHKESKGRGEVFGVDLSLV
jgi:hypothetical protein